MICEVKIMWHTVKPYHPEPNTKTLQCPLRSHGAWIPVASLKSSLTLLKTPLSLYYFAYSRSKQSQIFTLDIYCVWSRLTPTPPWLALLTSLKSSRK
jgi:hypothetical protein